MQGEGCQKICCFESNMKNLLIVLGVLSILSAGISFAVTSSANAEDGGHELVLEAVVTFITGNSSTLAKGKVLYAELDLFREGKVG